jgi:glycosyltransferase involved in cell wall biosynthesis
MKRSPNKLFFSVLMSIYQWEKPDNFTRAMKSVWDEQTIKPNEIILVQDGLLTTNLLTIVDEWKAKLVDVLIVVPIETNVGLGAALNIGFQHCTCELVARMDTDDIAQPHRFEKQLKAFSEMDIDVCGSWISEFISDEVIIIAERKVPKCHNDIAQFSKKRSPLNHVTVMFKQSKVKEAGGYQKMISFEDYYLWIRMLQVGAIMYNIQESLVNVRAGYEQLDRRRGFKYAKAEYDFLIKLYTMGFYNPVTLVLNILIRFSIRIAPKKMVEIIYEKLRN